MSRFRDGEVKLTVLRTYPVHCMVRDRIWGSGFRLRASGDTWP